MRILVTNDDGINAEGLDVCEQIARALSDDVWVVAPEYDQSGVAHSLSINDPLRLRSIGPRRFAVKGTPTDCVIMGADHLMKDGPPDLVLSGVNCGRNAGEDVTYSGTVAGAIEGAMLDIPSVALSQAYAMSEGQAPHWDTAIQYAPDLIRRVLAEGIPKDVLVNMNFPDCAPDKVRGVSVTTQGKRNQAQMAIEGRRDGRGNPYYWIAFKAAAKAHHARQYRSLGAGGQPHLDDALAARHDRRAFYDPAGGSVRVSVTFKRQQLRQHLLQLVELKRLLQGRPVAIGVGQAAAAIAGDEHEGQAALADQVGHRIDVLAIEIHVQDGEIEFLGPGQLGRLIDAAGDADQVIAEVGKHIFQQHADQEFVLDHENTAPSSRRSWDCGQFHGAVPVSRADKTAPMKYSPASGGCKGSARALLRPWRSGLNNAMPAAERS